jgi:transcriptional antiterminator
MYTAINQTDRDLIGKLKAERERLLLEVEKLDNATLAEKFNVSVSTVSHIPVLWK